VNLLVIIMDDQATDCIAALGNPHISTPNLDRLVRGGSYFEPYTTVPVCTPARAEVLTGRSALTNGCAWFGQPIDPALTLLPQALRQAGYHTCHIGKWHNDGHPRDRGYDETHCVFTQDLLNSYTTHHCVFEEDDQRLEGHATDLFTDQTERFLRRQMGSDQPWHCWLGLVSPHDPRIAPEPFASMYQEENLPPLPENFMPEHPFDTGDMMIRDERLAGFPRTQAEIRRHRADYYAMISHHDAAIGRLLDTLEQTGQRKNTLIAFMSDHGLAVGRHGLMGKENGYEHAIRVPLILSGPGIPSNRRFHRECLNTHYDFLPTILDWLGLDHPPTVEGLSYAPVLRGEKPTRRDMIFANYRDRIHVARDHRFKLIHYTVPNRTQLFDLREDPLEMNDLLTPWRRDPVYAGIPDDTPAPHDKNQSNPILNPAYIPSHPREFVDQKITQLQRALQQWLSECLHPNDQPE
jgi:arylsulfatase A-like enzyme